MAKTRYPLRNRWKQRLVAQKFFVFLKVYSYQNALLDFADCLVRTIPAEDLTNGFFVSCFIRKSAAESNKRPLEEQEIDSTKAAQSPNKKKKKNNKKKKVAITQ